MILVVSRLNLFNQEGLIKERDALAIYDIILGLTGMVQLQNIDMSTPKPLVETDKQMNDTLNIKNYFKYVFMTVIGSVFGVAVK